MINGSSSTDPTDSQISQIKSRYSTHPRSISSDIIISDILTILKILDTQSTKDPRVTIELAKLRKENSYLKKELSKFFPDKDSIENTSKKLEHLFKIDTATLIRYENSDLKEKNEKLLSEIEKSKQKSEEISVKLKEEQNNHEKIKEISSELRMENANLVLKNRELLKKLKVYEDQSQVVGDLGHKLKGALDDLDKNYTTEEPSFDSEPPVKNSKLMSRLANKKPEKLDVSHQFQVLCKPQNKFRLGVQKNIQVHIKSCKAKISLKLEKNEKIFCRPRPVKKITPENPVVSAYLDIFQETSVGCKAKKPRLKMALGSILEIKPKRIQKKPSTSLTLFKCSSLVIRPKIKSKEQFFPPKPKLSTSKTISASLQPKKKHRKMMISKPSTASLIPKKSEKPQKKLRISNQISDAYIPPPLVLALFSHSHAFRSESEEFEVFNAEKIYKPDLSVSEAHYLFCVPLAKVLKLETFSVSVKQKPQKLQVLRFNGFVSLKKLEIQNQRKLGFVPEGEENKSTSGSKRRARGPARKPAIEEYFNLTFQTLKMNFQDRDKISGLNCDELLAKATQSGIQFNMYHDWLREQFNIAATTAAKRPSVMVKK